jgi:hypothetical protein
MLRRVLASDLEQCGCDLAQARHLHRFHQHSSNTLSHPRAPHLSLSLGAGLARAALRVPMLEAFDTLDLEPLLIVSRPSQLDLRDEAGFAGIDVTWFSRRQSGTRRCASVAHYSSDSSWIFDRWVHQLHRAEHSATLADPFEFGQHGLFHELGELFDDERAL